MSMYIEDDELRGIYEGTSAEQIARIEAGLLKLEGGNSADAGVLDELLRDLHSFKGDSRMLGVTDAEGIAHCIEDILGEVSQGDRQLAATDFDRLYRSVDALRQIAREAIAGEPSGIDSAAIVAELGGSAAPGTARLLPDNPLPDLPNFENLEGDAAELAALLAAARAAETAAKSAPNFAEESLDLDEADFEPIEDSPPTTTGAETAAPAGGAARETVEYQIDSVRVTASQLDGLAARAGELAVTKLRFERRLQDIDVLLRRWETWSVARAPEDVAAATELEALGQQVRQLRTDAGVDTDRLEAIVGDLERGIRNLRLLPLATIFNLFPRTVRDLARTQGKEIDLEIEGGDILADKRILEEIKDPLTHLLRNAIDHGIESPEERLTAGKSLQGTLRLRGARAGNRLALEISDDGRGLDVEAIARTAERRGLHSRAELEAMPPGRLQNLIFAPGFSTRTTVTEISGRGVGLDIVRANVERLKGTIQVESTPGKGSTFRLNLGTDLSTTTAFVVSASQQIFAVPVDFVRTAVRVRSTDIFTVAGSPTITFEGQPVAVARLAELLELPVREGDRTMPCIILQAGGESLGILVDELLAHQEIALKATSKLLQRVRNVLGATILGTGKICTVLNPRDLIATAAARSGRAAATPLFAEIKTRPPLLLVEDSLPIRTQVRRILEGAGYDVTVAVDGSDGWEKLRAGKFAGVVSDVEMPNLSGLELTERIRQHPEYADLPIILVTTLAKESDRRRGAVAGANAYLTKGDFDQTLLLDILRRFI